MKTDPAITVPPVAPTNGQPQGLAESVEHEAIAYRSQGTEFGDFLAGQLERLAQLIRWTDADTPAEYLDRIEVWEENTKEHAYERGRQQGLAEAHEFRTFGPLGRPLDPSCPYRSTGGASSYETP